jgi:hypothetical protein
VNMAKMTQRARIPDRPMCSRWTWNCREVRLRSFVNRLNLQEAGAQGEEAVQSDHHDDPHECG